MAQWVEESCLDHAIEDEKRQLFKGANSARPHAKLAVGEYLLELSTHPKSMRQRQHARCHDQTQHSGFESPSEQVISRSFWFVEQENLLTRLSAKRLLRQRTL